MATDVPTWSPFAADYDPSGQAAIMVRSVAEDGMSVNFVLDRLTMLLQGDQDRPFAAALGMAGQPAFPITMTMQARRRGVDEFVGLTIADFRVIVARSL